MGLDGLGYPHPALSERPRVLLCSFEIFPGPTGGSRRLSAYLPALSERYDVVALTVKSPELSHIERVGNARLLRVPVSSDLFTRVQTFERAVRRQLQSETYALVHFTGPFGGYPLCEEREKHGYRLLYEALGFPSQEQAFQHPELEKDRRLLSRFRRQELFCLMNADRVLTGSEVTRDFVRNQGVAAEAVQVLRAPVEPVRAAPEQSARPDGTLHLLYVGSQAPYQGLPTLLRAVAQTVDRADVRLKIVGPRHPDWHPQLQELASELKLTDRVELLSPLSGPAWTELLAQTDACVIPLEDVDRNREQGGPLAKASEALGAGKAVVASDLPLTRELLPPQATLFVPPGDPTALADQLVALAQDPPRRKALGKAAGVFARAHLDSGRICAQLLSVYEDLLGAEAGRAVAIPKPRGPKDVTKVLPVPLPDAPDKDPTDPENRTFPPTAAPREPPRAPPPRPTPAPTRSTPVRTPAPRPQALPGKPALPPALPRPQAAPPRAPTPIPSPPRASTPPPLRPALSPPPLIARVSGPPPGVEVLPGADELEEISSEEILDADDVGASDEAPATDNPLAPLEAASAEAALQTAPEPLPPEPEPAWAEPAPAPVLDAFDAVEALGADDVDEVDEVEAVEDPEAIEEILEADAAVDVPPTIPGGLIDPWLSQVLFGHCPPESTHFARPTPPTNFPGRDQPGSARSASTPGMPAQPLSKPAGV